MQYLVRKWQRLKKQSNMHYKNILSYIFLSPIQIQNSSPYVALLQLCKIRSNPV